MTLTSLVFGLYYLVVSGGAGAVTGFAAGGLTAAVLRNSWRNLLGDMALGALVVYGGYQLRVYLVNHTRVFNASERQWLEFLVAGLVAVAHEVHRYRLRRRSA